jgi:hypothetical protein
VCSISVQQFNKVLLKAAPSTDTFVEGRACEYIESSNCSVNVLLSVVKWRTKKVNGRLVWRREPMNPVRKSFNVRIDKVTNALELKIKDSLEDLSIFQDPPEVTSVNNNYGTCDGDGCDVNWALNCCGLYFDTYLSGDRPLNEAGTMAVVIGPGVVLDVLQSEKEAIRDEAKTLVDQFNSQPSSSRALGETKYRIGEIEEGSVYDAVHSKVMQMFDSGTWEAAMNYYSTELGYPPGPWPENDNPPNIIGGLVAIPISPEKKGACGGYNSISDDQDVSYFLNSNLDKEVGNVIYEKEYTIPQPESINGTACEYGSSANFLQMGGSAIGSENLNVYIGV